MTLNIQMNVVNQEERSTFFTQKAEVENRKTFFAGNTNLANDPIAQKRKEAQEKAMKVVTDAWESDKAIDKSVDDRQKHYQEMLKVKETAQAELKRIEEEKAELKEAYGVADDSKEQKDLEFIEKVQDYLGGDFHNGITEEDLVDYVELQKEALTEYQKRSLELYDMAKKFKADLKDADEGMRDDIADMKAIARERLKSDPMLDAKKTADSIIASANEEIIGMAMQEAKEHIDEKMEEAEEKAEEQAEKEEVKEEKLEDIRVKKALQKAMVEGTKEAVEEAEARQRQRENEAVDMPMEELVGLVKMNGETQKAQKVLNEIKYSMNLLEADLKGIKVDEEV